MFVNDVGKIGLIADKPPHSLPLNAWSDGQNVRMFESGVEKMTGHRSAIGTPSVAPYFMLPVRGSSNEAFWIYAGGTAIYVTQGGQSGTHKNITRSSGAYSASTSSQDWSGFIFGGVPILNNSSDVPQMWNPVNFTTPQLLQDLTNWPTGLRCKSLSSFKQFMIAMDITKPVSGVSTHFPRVIKWSHASEANSVPSSWDETSATLDAGEYELADSQGEILSGKQLRDSFLIYKSDSIWGMNFIGTPYIFRFYEVSTQYGAISRHSVLEVEGGHIVFANGDLLLCDGHAVKSLMTQRMRRFLFNSIDAENYKNSFLALNQPKNEVWICYPVSGASWPNRVVIWNYKENTFGVRDLPEGTTYGTNGVVNPSDDLDWSSSSGWDSVEDNWDAKVFNPSQTRLMISNATSTKLYLVDTTNQFDSVNATSYIERTGLHFDKPDIVKLATQVNLNFEKTGTGEIEVLVGSHDSPEGSVSWSSPEVIDPTTEAGSKVDGLVSGKYLALRIQSNANVGWKLHSYKWSLTEMGTN